jgi:hypothetical protein
VFETAPPGRKMCNIAFNGERSVQGKGVNMMKEMKNEDKEKNSPLNINKVF